MMGNARKNFDEWLDEQQAEINEFPISEVRAHRKRLIVQLNAIHDMMRENGITEARKKYLKGRRKFQTRLIAYCNERIKLFNLVAHNGVSKNLALRFVQTAMEILPQPVFQRIYGITQVESEEAESTIDEIRQFVEEFKKI